MGIDGSFLKTDKTNKVFYYVKKFFYYYFFNFISKSKLIMKKYRMDRYSFYIIRVSILYLRIKSKFSPSQVEDTSLQIKDHKNCQKHRRIRIIDIKQYKQIHLQKYLYIKFRFKSKFQIFFNINNSFLQIQRGGNGSFTQQTKAIILVIRIKGVLTKFGIFRCTSLFPCIFAFFLSTAITPIFVVYQSYGGSIDGRRCGWGKMRFWRRICCGPDGRRGSCR